MAWRWRDVPVLLLSAVQALGSGQLSVTPWAAARQASLSTTISQSLLKLMSIELVMLSIESVMASYPLWSLSPPALNLSQNQGLFQ